MGQEHQDPDARVVRFEIATPRRRPLATERPEAECGLGSFFQNNQVVDSEQMLFLHDHRRDHAEHAVLALGVDEHHGRQ